MEARPSGRIKGAALREALVWLEESMPPEKLERLAEVLAAHGAETNRDLPALGVLSSRWYPAEPLHALCDELVDGLSRSEARDLAYQAAFASLERSFTRFHRFVLRRLASPKLHPTFGQRLWDGHFDSGRVTVELTGPHRSIVHFGEWTSHHRFMCDMSTASDVLVYQAMGLKDVQSKQLTCVDQGASDCAHVVTWA